MIASASLLVPEFIVDCSVTMTWCFEDEATPNTDALLKRLRFGAAIVPTHWPLEVASVLRNSVKRGRVTPLQSQQFVFELKSLAIVVEPMGTEQALDQILPLAVLHGLTPYDAAYLELALRLGLPLATLDKELLVAAQTLGVTLL